jgi:hypothetical protein
MAALGWFLTRTQRSRDDLAERGLAWATVVVGVLGGLLFLYGYLRYHTGARRNRD